MNLGKLVQKFPKDPTIYGKFIRAKKDFKRTVKQKFIHAKNKILENIMSCEKNDPKTYWKLLNQLKQLL